MTLEKLLRLRSALVSEVNTWNEIQVTAKSPGMTEHAKAAKEQCSRQLRQIEAELSFRTSATADSRVEYGRLH